VTVSFSKSISVLHASLRENERRARLARDEPAAAYWTRREQQFQEALHGANRAALDYLQAWAGITRTGYHGTRVDDREPGRFEAAGLIVTSWLQGTSRDGDPQDHIHNQIARIVRTYRDGKWRVLDTMSVRAVLGALQAVAAIAVVRADARVWRGVDSARGRPRQRDPWRDAGADGRVLHADGAGAREGTRAGAGVGAQARPRADLARAAPYRQRHHPAVTQG
jgi:TrwC relaxase